MFRLALYAMAFVLPTLAAEEPPKKRVLTHADQDIWNAASGVTLSPDGRFLAYTVAPAVGEATFVVKNIPTGAEYRFYAGNRTGATPAAPKSDADQIPAAAAAIAALRGPSGGPTFTPDSKALYFVLQPTKEEVAKARAAKTPLADVPRPVLAVLDTATGKVTTRHEKVRSFSLLGDGAGILVRVMEPEPEAKAAPKPMPPAKKEVAPTPRAKGEPTPKKEAAPAPPAKGESTPDQRGKKGDKGGKAETPRARTGTDLIVTDLAGGREATFAEVGAYSITRDLRTIAFVVISKDAARAGVYFSTLLLPHATAVRSGAGRYYGLTWDEKQTQLAFYFDDNATPPPPQPKSDPANPTAPLPAPSADSLARKPKVFVWQREAQSPPLDVTAAIQDGLRKGWQVVDRGGLDFSADGLKLSVSTAPTPDAAAKGKGGQDRVELDLWHWKDEAIQPMQRVQANAERTRSYRAVYFLDTKKFVHLADKDRGVTTPEFGDWGVGVSNAKYRGQTWNYPSPADYALVNVRTGESKPVVTAHVGGLSPSPKNGFLVGFDGHNWYTLSVPDGTKTVLTAKLGVKFFNEEFDSPSQTPPYGLAGWSLDEKSLYVYDRFDVWQLDPTGKRPAKRLTDGRAAKTEHRLIRVEKPDDPRAAPERGLNPAFPWLLATENLDTRDTGVARLGLDGTVKHLISGARKYSRPTKATDADVYLFTIQTFRQYPDYYVADGNFAEVKRVTDLNPRVKEFNWGTAELVPFETTDGAPLKAVLVKPENFDPSKKYPMVVYIYERLTDNLHTFRVPSVTRGQVINPTFYASNGYLVLMPDILYETGFPGQSAMECVLPAIQEVVNKGFVNEKAIGINGQSWGGYQIAYLVTRTNRFKAAVAGAPVSNMTSAYNGVRWGSGMPRQFQYERTQSRIGETLWQAPLKYLENSPVFAADRVKTPLMMIHNDQDDAVPWYQGVEYYLALRRLGKEVYLLNYNGEPHNLRKRGNARDFALRMHQFFDHHLKGKPMPEWMAKGVPFLERDEEKEQWKKLFAPEGKK